MSRQNPNSRTRVGIGNGQPIRRVAAREVPGGRALQKRPAFVRKRNKNAASVRGRSNTLDERAVFAKHALHHHRNGGIRNAQTFGELTRRHGCIAVPEIAAVLIFRLFVNKIAHDEQDMYRRSFILLAGY